MTDESDILGKPLPRKPRVVSESVELTGPSFEELCKPLSATVMPKWREALTSALGAHLQQRRNIKIPKVRNKW